MDTQAAQIQKKLQVELDNYKSSQKGEIIFFSQRLKRPNVFMMFFN